MQFLSVILSLAVLASARPSPSYGNEMEAITGSQIAVGAPCNTGQRYCLGQIVTDLGMDMQDLLHQYCAQQYKVDALSCHACTKFPNPTPDCAAAYPAWNSAMTCKGNNEYTFAYRCESWCSAGECIERP